MIAWDRDKLRSLTEQYAGAKEAGHSSFTWQYRESRFSPVTEKHEFDIRYAKYLIEYLRGQFNNHPDQPARPNRDGEDAPESGYEG